MSFRRKLIIAFSIVSLLPLILTIAGFEVVRRVLPRDAAMVPKRVIITLGVMVVVILMVTALLMISWIKSSILDPINQLKTAMSRIRDGNLDYRLTTEEEGEIGELYQGYEDMRLRLKESADEKLQNDKHDRELISNISHDLKTPITSIKGYVEGLLDGVANTPEKQEKYLRTIYNKVNDMVKLINELTIYSKIDNDKIPYNFRRINLSDYFGDCVEEIGMDLESRNIELNYSNLLSRDTEIIADQLEDIRIITDDLVAIEIFKRFVSRLCCNDKLSLRLDRVECEFSAVLRSCLRCGIGRSGTAAASHQHQRCHSDGK